MTVAILIINVIAIVSTAASAAMDFSSDRTFMGIAMSALCTLNMACFILNIWRLFV